MHRTNVSINSTRYPMLEQNNNKKYSLFDMLSYLCQYCYRYNTQYDYDSDSSDFTHEPCDSSDS
jgi:hypothetical protein